MPTTRDIKRIVTGGNGVKRVMYRDAQVWPTAYTAVLEVVWVFGGQYAINAIPAGGGTATAQIWSLSIYRQSDGQLVDTVPVTPTVTIGDTTNFSYDAATGVWLANDRGRNGINSTSGTTAPSNAPARSCTLHAAVQYTYHGVNVSASYDTTMTQNANNYTPGTAYYTNLQVELKRYNSSASPAPAYESTATISASLDQNTPGEFSSGSAYTYIQPNAVGSNRFSFTESASWLSISGTTVTVSGRGTDDGAPRNASILATFTGDTSIKSSVTLYQRDNYRYEKSRTYSSYETLLSDSRQGHGYEGIEIPKEGGYVYLIGTAWYDVVYGWPSNAPDTTGRDYRSQDPTYIYSDPSSGVTIDTSNARVQLPANSTSTPKEYDLWGAYTEDGVTRSSDRYSATVLGVAQEYGTPVVSIEYEDIAAGYHIAASGGSAVPVISFSQPIMQGGTVVGYVRGSLSNGATSGTADDGTTFSVSFSGTGANGGSIARGGTVSIGSRGTREGSARNAATGIIAVVTSHGQSGQSNEVSAVVQQENRPYPYDAYDRYDETYINRFVILGTTATRIPRAKDTTVTVEVKAKWEHFFAGVEYTSREHTGGGSEYHDEIVTPSYLDVDGATGGYGVTSFTASNKHVESTKTYTVSAIYGGNESPDRTIDQAADYKVTGQTRNYTADISISGDLWAGGGEATITSYATHEEFSKWNSDNTEVSGSATTEYDVATVFTKSGTSSRFGLGSGTRRSDGGYDYIVTHDDMMNNAATDALVVQAKNGSNQSVTSSELRRTITNSPSSSAVYSSYYADGSAYYGNYRVDDFSVDDYDSSSSKAPSSGGAVRYSVSASHDRLRKYSRDAYYYFDSNWGSQHGGVDHNDAGHRNTVSKADSEIRVLQTYPNDSVTFSTSDSWLTVNTSTGYVIIGAQSQGGEARYGQVFAKNSGDTSSWPGRAVGIYQYGYASISTSAAGGVTFPAGGGSVNIKIYSANTTWSISYGPPDISMPSLSFVPSSGGDMDDDDMETTVRITAGQNDRPTFLMGTVTIVPDAPGLSSVTFRVSQASLASS